MWEIALAITPIGIAFILIYLSNSIQGWNYDGKPNVILQIMKVFLYLVALIMLIVIASMPQSIIFAANQTADTAFTNVTYASLENQIVTPLKIIIWTIWLFIGLFLLYIINLFIKMWNWRKDED